MKDGSIDGLVWSGGLPTGGITDLMTAMKDEVQFVDITPLLPKLKEVNPVYAEDVIPAATYGTAADAKTDRRAQRAARPLGHVATTTRAR